MNKNSIYIGIAVVIGLLAGWLIFGNATPDASTTKDLTDMSDSHEHAQEVQGQQWTCSMHPQIMQPESGDCPICGMDLIAAEVGAEGLNANEIKMTPNAMALANIQTTQIGGGLTTTNEDGAFTLSGKIAVNDENNSVQASYFDGRLERLSVNYEGQQINRGQLLATIYAPALVAAQQELITAATLKATQPALYNAVRNKLKNWKLSESQISSIETTGKVIDNFPIYATVSGTVVEVLAREGDYVKQGAPILKVSNLNSVWAAFDAYENQIAKIALGQEVTVVANAYPEKSMAATVSFIDPVLNTSTRTVTVRATLNNNTQLLKPGMFVRGQFKSQGAPTESVVIIPATAVLWTGERSLVYVKTNPNEAVFEMRQVTLGARIGDQYEVVSGLQTNEVIVTNGTFTVDAAAQLQGKKSMMNQGGEVVPTEGAASMKMEFSKAFSEGFERVIPFYLKMKDAFVESDSQKVATYAKSALKVLQSIELPKGQMEKAHLQKSIEMLEAIANNQNIENQRAHYVILNENMVPMAIQLEAGTTNLYVQRCPMANNNEGALWISSEPIIRNPYYGDAMLSCGSVIEEIN